MAPCAKPCHLLCTYPAALHLCTQAVPGLDPSCSLTGQYAPVLVLDQLSTAIDKGDEGFEVLAWGGGPAYLLAAASRQHVHIISTRHFFLKEAAQFAHAPCGAAGAGGAGASTVPLSPRTSAATPPSHTSYTTDSCSRGLTLPLPSDSWQLVASYRLAQPLLAMDWTQCGDGLLLSDAGHNVTMLSVDVQGVDSVYVAQVGTGAWLLCMLMCAALDCTSLHKCTGHCFRDCGTVFTHTHIHTHSRTHTHLHPPATLPGTHTHPAHGSTHRPPNPAGWPPRRRGLRSLVCEERCSAPARSRWHVAWQHIGYSPQPCSHRTPRGVSNAAAQGHHLVA